MAKMNLFDHLSNLTVNKIDYDVTNDEMDKTYAPYMINRFISMSEIYLPLVNEINRCQNLPKEAHYTYFKNVLPKRKLYFKYLKKKNEIKENDKEMLCKYFKIGPRQVDEYISILTKEQVKIIVDKYQKNRSK